MDLGRTGEPHGASVVRLWHKGLPGRASALAFLSKCPSKPGRAVHLCRRRLAGAPYPALTRRRKPRPERRWHDGYGRCGAVRGGTCFDPIEDSEAIFRWEAVQGAALGVRGSGLIGRRKTGPPRVRRYGAAPRRAYTRRRCAVGPYRPGRIGEGVDDLGMGERAIGCQRQQVVAAPSASRLGDGR